MPGQGRPVSYPEVGATAGPALPAGYRHLELSCEVDAALADAAEFLLTWGLHARAGLHPRASATRAQPGEEVSLWFAGLRAPCRVVWVVEDEVRVGFAYGTQDGHPERGEASFLLEALAPGRTRFTVRSFSRPGRWFTRAAAPIARTVQRRLTARFLHTMIAQFTAAAS